MKRKDINIFGTSFLDLLSGALAAVIILFIIVPKMTSSQQDALEEIERMNIQVEDLSSLIAQLENSVPQNVFDELQQRLEELQQTISNLTTQVENLQQRVETAEAQNESLRSEIEQLREANQQLQERVQELQDRQPQQDGQGISDGKVFGINAEVGVVCFWREDVDVDLHVYNLSNGEHCYFGNTEFIWGKLNQDIQRRTSQNDDRFELFYQEEVVPGTYEVSLVFFDGRTNRAHVEGYFVMHPGSNSQIKIPYRDVDLVPNNRVGIKIGRLTVTNSSISFQQYNY